MDHIIFPKKFEASYVFKDKINRIFNLIRDFHIIEELNAKTPLPYMLTNKPIPMSFTYSLCGICSFEHNKKIHWNIYTNPPSSIVIKETFNLILNTIDNSTLLIFSLSITEPTTIEKNKTKKVIDACNKICVEIINNIDNLLQVNHENIYQYESEIINVRKEILWDYILHPSNFDNNLFGDFESKGNIEEIGTIVEINSKSLNDKHKIKVVGIDKNPNKKKWKFITIPIDGPYKEQIIKYELIAIDNNSTFFSVCHVFEEPIDSEDLAKIKNGKKKLFRDLKDLLKEKKM